MSKRRRTVLKENEANIFGDISENQLLKPLYNRDIPSKAELVDFIYISDDKSLAFANTTTDILHKEYGDILLYKFPKCEQVCPLTALTEKTMLPTHHIYDVDMYCQMKDDRGTYKDLIFDAGADKLLVGKYKDANQLTNYKISTGFEGLQNTSWDNFKNRRKGYIFFVMSDAKRQELGDWIEENKTIADSDMTYYLGNRVEGATAWLFDRFCKELKPMFARYCYWEQNSKNYVQTVKVKTGTASTDVLEIPIPEAASISETGKWQFRDFHRRMDEANLTPSDTYANQLLIGSLCGSIRAAQHLRVRIYYNATKVNASTLYFQQNRDFQRPVWSGCRVEYGNEDFYPEGDKRLGQKTKTLENAKLPGVLTCNIGEIEYFKNGKKKKIVDKTNILQDESDGKWY